MMNEMELSVKAGIHDWSSDVIKTVFYAIQKRKGKHLDGKEYNELMQEVIEGIVKQAAYVAHISPLSLEIPKHNNNIELSKEGVTIKEHIIGGSVTTSSLGPFTASCGPLKPYPNDKE